MYYSLLIIIIILIIYCWSYYIYPKEVQIIQARMLDFKYNGLYLKQPVVITHNALLISDIAKLWFYLNKVSHFCIDASDTANPIWYENKYKYCVLKPHVNGEIIIYPASGRMTDGAPNADESLIALQVKPGHMIILPLHWKYMTTVNVECIGVHDIVSYFLR